MPAQQVRRSGKLSAECCALSQVCLSVRRVVVYEVPLATGLWPKVAWDDELRKAARPVLEVVSDDEDDDPLL